MSEATSKPLTVGSIVFAIGNLLTGAVSAALYLSGCSGNS
jgi:hypothetical protein